VCVGVCVCVFVCVSDVCVCVCSCARGLPCAVLPRGEREGGGDTSQPIGFALLRQPSIATTATTTPQEPGAGLLQGIDVRCVQAPLFFLSLFSRCFFLMFLSPIWPTLNRTSISYLFSFAFFTLLFSVSDISR